MSDIAKFLERLYQGFLLRDILGFIAPGSISLISLSAMFGSSLSRITPSLITNLWGDLSITWRAIAFLVASYLLAWTLQALHYGVLNVVIKPSCFGDRFSKLGPLADSTDTQEIEKHLKQSPIVTRGALEPDLVLAKSMSEGMLENRLRELPYTERASALLIMSGNLAIATVLLVSMLIHRTNEWQWAFGFLIPCFLYIEYWRLWEARNLQVAIYSVGFRQKACDQAKRSTSPDVRQDNIQQSVKEAD